MLRDTNVLLWTFFDYYYIYRKLAILIFACRFIHITSY